MSIEQRFWCKVALIPFHTCWEWTGAIRRDGYGHMKVDKQYLSAHRLSWELHNGAIPEREGFHGTVVMHTCDNKRCVNPAHLQLGAQSDNIKDCYNKGRSILNVLNTAKAKRDKCLHGHTLVQFKNGRYCRVCSKLRMRKRRAAGRLS